MTDNPLIAKQPDGSWHFEWIFPGLRFGLAIETNPAESGWYIVNNSEFGAAGKLPADVAQAVFETLEKR